MNGARDPPLANAFCMFPTTAQTNLPRNTHLLCIKQAVRVMPYILVAIRNWPNLCVGDLTHCHCNNLVVIQTLSSPTQNWDSGRAWQITVETDYTFYERIDLTKIVNLFRWGLGCGIRVGFVREEKRGGRDLVVMSRRGLLLTMMNFDLIFSISPQTLRWWCH